MMQYTIDLHKISLAEYQELLKRQTLLPSRRLLLDAIDERLSQIASQGIDTVARLLDVLSSPAKIAAFAAQCAVPVPYLTVLKREAGAMKQKPVPLSAFPDTDKAEIEAMEQQGVRTSKDCWERRPSDGRLYALCDLVRVNGIGPSAAAMFFAAGYRSAAEIAGAQASALLARVTAVNADHRYYAGTLGQKDMQFCIDFAKLLIQLES